MTDIDIDFGDFYLSGWVFTNRLERRLERMCEHVVDYVTTGAIENYESLITTLEEVGKGGRVRKLYRIAIWKTRESKFKRYYNNFKECFTKNK